MSVLTLAGASLLTDPSGALVWPEAETLIVADLHLEKGSAYARHGTLLPPYDTRQTLMRLEDALRRHRPRRVVALGDSFHDGRGPENRPTRFTVPRMTRVRTSVPVTMKRSCTAWRISILLALGATRNV